VQQGDTLSATIFNLILYSVIKTLNLRGDVSLKVKQIVAYADDVALLAKSLKVLNEIFHKLKNEANLGRIKYQRRQNQIYANKENRNK